MPDSQTRLGWLKSGLFWRTFFLLAFMIAASMAAWVVSYRMVERAPRADQIAAQVVSIVTITRTALMHSAPDLRRELLFDLASNEGIRVYPREDSDDVISPTDTTLIPEIIGNVRARLGEDTHFANRVNDIPGFWVSFKIDDDDYWLMLDRDRVVKNRGLQWLGWAAITLLLSLIGAVFISRLINQPLSRLTRATGMIAKGRQPAPLPEAGPAEIREANRSFNHMMRDLQQIEADRAIILAGISHDLRTPIARMLLEVEMAQLPEETRQDMQADLSQMDAIIGQFLDYARPSDSVNFAQLDWSDLLRRILQEAGRLAQTRIVSSIQPDMIIRGNVTDLQRMVNNLIENARRYGKTPGTDTVELDIASYIENDKVILEIADHGPGIPEAEIEHLLRPFTRLDQARGQANGAGLGLAIVDKILQRHGATWRLAPGAKGGLTVRIALPLVKKKLGAVSYAPTPA